MHRVGTWNFFILCFSVIALIIDTPGLAIGFHPPLKRESSITVSAGPLPRKRRESLVTTRRALSLFHRQVLELSDAQFGPARRQNLLDLGELIWRETELLDDPDLHANTLNVLKTEIARRMIDESLCHASAMTGTAIVSRPINNLSLKWIADGADTKPLGIKAKTVKNGILGGLIPCSLRDLPFPFSETEIRLHENLVRDALAKKLGNCKTLQRYIGNGEIETAVVRDGLETFVKEVDQETDTKLKILASVGSEAPMGADLDLFLVAVPIGADALISSSTTHPRKNRIQGVISPLEIRVIELINSRFNELFHYLRDSIHNLSKERRVSIAHHGAENWNPNPLKLTFPMKKTETSKTDCRVTHIVKDDLNTVDTEEFTSALDGLVNKGYRFRHPRLPD